LLLPLQPGLINTSVLLFFFNELYLLCYLLLFFIPSCQRSLQSGFSLFQGSALIDSCLIRSRTAFLSSLESWLLALAS